MGELYFDLVKCRMSGDVGSGNLVTSEFLSGNRHYNDPRKARVARIEEALVQGTLVRHLATKAKAHCGKWMMRSILFQLAAYSCFVWAAFQIGGRFIELAFNADLVGGIMIAVVDALINRCSMELITIDFVLHALVKLRLYNGYMAEDTDLTNLSVLFQFPAAVNRYFKAGVAEANAVQNSGEVEEEV